MLLPAATLYPHAVLWPSVAAARDITVTFSVDPDRFTAQLQPDRFTAALGADMPRVIRTSLGAVENLVGTVTEITGADISGAPIEVSIGSYSTPGAWLEPDGVTHPTPATAVAELLVGSTLQPPAGRYWLWLRVTDNSEIIPVRAARSFTIA